MSIFSDIGNVMHSIGNLLGNQDNQQQQQKPVVVQPRPQTQAPTQQAPIQTAQAPQQTVSIAPQQPNPSVVLNQTPDAMQGGQQTPQLLQKAPVTTQPAKVNAPSGGGFLHDITHNDVTNVAGDIAKGVAAPFVYLGKTDIVDPTKELVDQATGNQAAYNKQYQSDNQELGLGPTGTNLAGGLKKWAGNSAGALLTVAAPAADNAVEDIVGNAIDRVAPDASARVANIAAKGASGATLGAGFGAAQGVANGDDLKQTLESAGQGALVGGALGAVGGGLAKAESLNKANTATDVRTPLDSQADKAPDEIAVGVRSANPNMVADAQQQLLEKAQDNSQIEMNGNTPSFARGMPNTVGEAAAQHALGVNNLPDSTFDADARVAGGPAPNPLDVPAFMRNSADAQLQDANTRIAQADQKIANLQKATGQTGKFNDRAAITQAFAESPTKGRALAKYIAARNTRVNPGAELTKVLADRVQAVKDASAAKDAIAARDELAQGVRGVNPDEAQQAAEQATANTPELPQFTNPQASSELPTNQPIQPAAQLPEQPQNPALSQPATPTLQPAVQPQLQAPSEPISQNPSLPNNVAQPQEVVNPQTGRVAPNAPAVRPGLAKNLADAAVKAGDPSTHDVFSNQELDTAAKGVVANTPPHELVTKYSGVPKMDNAADLAHAKASLPVLANLSHSPDEMMATAAKNAIDNIIEGAEKGVSGAGRTMNYAQSLYDSLPKEARVSLTIRTLNKARVAAGKDPLDVADQAEVESRLMNLLTKGEDIQNQLAAVQGKAQQVVESLKSGEKSPATNAELRDLNAQHGKLELQAQAQNGATARYYNSLLPGKAKLQQAADWARTSMLTAPSGRINNIFNVSGNSLYEIARSIPQAVLNKGINLVSHGKTEDSSLLNRGLGRGLAQGLRTAGQDFKGEALVKELKGAAGKSTGGNPYELVQTADNRGLNKVTNFTRAMVKAPSNVIGGAIKDAQMMRLARQEGQQLGLKGADLRTYANARSIVPSKDMVAKAQLLQDQVSHMNKNWLADTVGKILGADAKNQNISGVAGLIRNTLLPFPKYAATFTWNTLTDRNVLADTVRAANALRKGDLNALTKAISGGALDSTAMYVGYHLAQQGLISKTDANGYSDDGMYLHLGDRYIPLGFIGVTGEGLLAGAAMHDAVNSKGDAVSQFGNTIASTALDTVKMAGAQDLIGTNDQGITALQQAFSGTNGVTPTGAAAILGGQAAGQFIPGAFSDVNSVLNQTGMDPTHDAAETKVTQGSQGKMTASGTPSTAKADVPSEVNSLINRIPVASQLMLPRNIAEASTDFTDRVTRGSHTGQPQAQTLAKQQVALSKVQQEVQQGVPVYTKNADGTKVAGLPKGYSFDNVVNNDIQTGHYGKAITGLQSELNEMNASKNVIPPSTKQPVQDRINQLKTLQSGNFPPSLMNTYASTSLTAWRDMGNPSNAAYNPTLYNQLYQLDQALTKAGVSGGNLTTAGKSSSAKYYLSTSSSSSGSGGTSASTLVKDNTIRAIPAYARENFTGQLTAKPINTKITQVKLTPPGGLIKAHKISVKSPTA